MTNEELFERMVETKKFLKEKNIKDNLDFSTVLSFTCVQELDNISSCLHDLKSYMEDLSISLSDIGEQYEKALSE